MSFCIPAPEEGSEPPIESTFILFHEKPWLIF